MIQIIKNWNMVFSTTSNLQLNSNQEWTITFLSTCNVKTYKHSNICGYFHRIMLYIHVQTYQACWIYSAIFFLITKLFVRSFKSENVYFFKCHYTRCFRTLRVVRSFIFISIILGCIFVKLCLFIFLICRSSALFVWNKQFLSSKK